MKRIKRKLPKSPLEVKGAINTAKSKKDSNPPGPQELKTETVGKPDTWCEDFNKQYNAATVAQAAVNTYTPLKVLARDKVRRFCSQFMHSMAFEIGQGVMKEGDRAFYSMDVARGKFLPLGSEAEIKLTAELLINGEKLRIAAGGTPIVYPVLADLEAVSDDFLKKVSDHSNLTDAMKIEKGKLNELTAGAINFIKVMWSEIESTYAADPKETMRDKARAWGVTYALVNNNIPVTVEVLDAETKQPVADAGTALERAGLQEQTNNSGGSKLFTPVAGKDVLKVVARGYVIAERNIETSNGKPLSVTIELQRAA